MIALLGVCTASLALRPDAAIAAACPDTLGTPPCDPITPDNPLWAIPKLPAGSSITVDGSLAEAAWSSALRIERTQPWRDDGPVVVLVLWSADGLYVAADVADENVWADGNGSGSGERYDVQHDDSLHLFFDPNASREALIQDGDRAFAVNLGAMGDPLSGAGTVRRWYYVKGTGSLAVNFGLVDVLPGGSAPAGALWASSIDGTVNSSASSDGGWATEVFLPWSALNMTAPSHGTVVGMNFDVIFDNDGGNRFAGFVDNRSNCSSAVLRIQTPAFVDDHVQGSFSSYSASQSGIQGPVNYAAAMFVDGAAGARPAAIADLTANGASAYGGRLFFTAPAGTQGGAGHVSSYEIRRSSSPITNETQWNAATVVENHYVPRLAGYAESLRVAELTPSSTHYFAVRARDAVGELGDLSNSAALTTTATAGASDRGRIIPSPAGSMLIFEDGTPFPVVGEHAGLSWPYFRNLYPGQVWGGTFDGGNQPVLFDFNAFPSFEGPAAPHFDTLESKGVRVLRIFLETLGLNFGIANAPAMPIGRYWIEYPRGVFNEDMREALENALALAAANDMYVLLSPLETFPWDEVFTIETPYYTGACGPNGCGPLSDIDDFFQNPNIYGMVVARLAEVISWVQESPNADRVLGWEGLNEWDSVEWTWHCFPSCEPGSESEMRLRAQFMHLVNDYLRTTDPDRLVFSSTTTRDPRGPVGRMLFYDRSIDVLAPHYYTNPSEEPFNNPDPDRKVRPAAENGLLSSYFLTHASSPRPLLNGEWGLTSYKCGGGVATYGINGFTQQQDEEIYRTVTWSGVASGQVGTGLRITSFELVGNEVGKRNELTAAMRDVEESVSAFLGWNRFDLARFDARPGIGSVTATSATKTLAAWGSTDGQQGIAYVLQDTNPPAAGAGTITDGQLTIGGVDPGGPYTVEFWDPVDGASATSSTQETVGAGGTLTIALPAFDTDLAVRFAPEPGAVATCAAALLALQALAGQRRRNQTAARAAARRTAHSA